MASFYSFIASAFAPKKKIVEKKGKVVSLRQMMDELGVRTDSVLGAYDEEERPDNLTTDDYINMQNNDGTIRAITRLFSMPIQSTQIKILPDKKDKGERDFIETVFLKPQKFGGMSTPLPFLIADMTRAIFEGYRGYEKVAQIIQDGEYKGKIGWKKIAPRDSRTIDIKVDAEGGFNGFRQQAMFGSKLVDVTIPANKCILFTFQKERHPFYGESILKTAYYHYDKKHKLYYLAHKKAEVDAIGVKVLKLSKPSSEIEVSKAEEAVDTLGVNSRITLPSGFELEINRASSGYDVLSLIEHHDAQIALSTLTQAIQLGTKSTYGYTYGAGYNMQGEFIAQMLGSIMKSMEDTLNEWAIPELIDWNFGSSNYPKIKLMPLKDDAQAYILKLFEALVTKDPSLLSAEYLTHLANNVSEKLGLEVKLDPKDAIKAFENGKKKESDKRRKPAPSTPRQIKEEIAKKALDMKDDPEMMMKFEILGREYAIKEFEKSH